MKLWQIYLICILILCSGGIAIISFGGILSAIKIKNSIIFIENLIRFIISAYCFVKSVYKWGGYV